MISNFEKLVPHSFGENASMRTGLKAIELGMKNVLLICDGGVRKAGVVDPIVQNLEQAGLKVTIFDKVLPDPPDVMVNECGQFAKDAKVDGIVAIGGGSSIDTAKAVAILVNNDLPISKWYGVKNISNTVPLIAIPTTAGTGSEVTSMAVITNTTTSAKVGVYKYADFAIIDPLLYLGMPLLPSVYCAFDAYTHAVDSFITNVSNPFSAQLSKEAIRLIHKHLPTLFTDLKNMEARSGLAFAALLGGYAFNNDKLHLTHAIGHTLGAVYHQPHGLCCIVGLPQLFETYYAAWMPDKVKELAECMGVQLPKNVSNEELGKTVGNAVLDFMNQAGVPTLKEMGLTEEDIKKTSALIVKDQVYAMSPVLLPARKFEELLLAAYENKRGQQNVAVS